MSVSDTPEVTRPDEDQESCKVDYESDNGIDEGIQMVSNREGRLKSIKDIKKVRARQSQVGDQT